MMFRGCAAKLSQARPPPPVDRGVALEPVVGPARLVSPARVLGGVDDHLPVATGSTRPSAPRLQRLPCGPSGTRPSRARRLGRGLSIRARAPLAPPPGVARSSCCEIRYSGPLSRDRCGSSLRSRAFDPPMAATRILAWKQSRSSVVRPSSLSSLTSSDQNDSTSVAAGQPLEESRGRAVAHGELEGEHGVCPSSPLPFTLTNNSPGRLSVRVRDCALTLVRHLTSWGLRATSSRAVIRR